MQRTDIRVTMPKDINIKLRIDRDTAEALKERADEAERSVAAEIRLAIRKHLNVQPQGATA